jgi:hypothetical protein
VIISILMFVQGGDTDDVETVVVAESSAA